jgi:predicted porin
MKKSLIALAALAATSAFAQSSVTLYGIVEAGVDIGYSARSQTVTTYRNNVGADITAGMNAATGTAGTPFVNGVAANAIGAGTAATLFSTAGTALLSNSINPVFGTNTRFENKPGFRVQDGNSQGTGTSRIGFRGTEDLGGGMKANFVLEMGIRVDDGCATVNNLTPATAGAPAGAAATTNCQSSGDSGANLFGRNAWGGVSGGFGEVRIGRQVLGSFAVQGNSGASGSSNGLYDMTTASLSAMGGVRFSDALTYISPDFGGFRGQLMLSAPEVTPATGGLTAMSNANAFSYTNLTILNAAGVPITINNKKKTGVDLALTYATGPVYVGFGYNTRDGGYGQSFNNGIVGAGNVNINTEGGAVRAYTLGGSYDFGVVKPFLNYTRQTTNANVMQNTNVAGVNVAQGLASDAVQRAWSLGVRAPFGPVTMIASYGTNKTTTNAAGINTVNAINNVGYNINTESSVKGFQIGGQYALSKRTSLQANYGQVTTDATAIQRFNGAVAATNGSSTATTNGKISGFNVGMKHSF